MYRVNLHNTDRLFDYQQRVGPDHAHYLGGDSAPQYACPWVNLHNTDRPFDYQQRLGPDHAHYLGGDSAPQDACPWVPLQLRSQSHRMLTAQTETMPITSAVAGGGEAYIHT